MPRLSMDHLVFSSEKTQDATESNEMQIRQSLSVHRNPSRQSTSRCSWRKSVLFWNIVDSRIRAGSSVKVWNDSDVHLLNFNKTFNCKSAPRGSVMDRLRGQSGVHSARWTIKTLGSILTSWLHQYEWCRWIHKIFFDIDGRLKYFCFHIENEDWHRNHT